MAETDKAKGRLTTVRLRPDVQKALDAECLKLGCSIRNLIDHALRDRLKLPPRKL